MIWLALSAWMRLTGARGSTCLGMADVMRFKCRSQISTMCAGVGRCVFAFSHSSQAVSMTTCGYLARMLIQSEPAAAETIVSCPGWK